MTIRRVIMSATSRIKGGRPSKPETKGEKNVATKAQIRAFQSKSSPIYKSQSESSLVSGFNNLSIADKRKQSSNKPPINRRGFCTSNSGRLNIRSLQDAAMLFKNEQVQNVVVVAGAGISTPSGIPDFRTPGTGLYDNLQQYKIPYPEAIFDIDYFHHNPKPFFTLAKELFPSLGNYRPNYIHYFVKLLHEKGLLLRMYTQNIDGLERLAGIPASKLVEAHGTFATATCTLCGDRCDGDDIKERISLEQIPKCKKKSCSGMVKPDIVFFGEDLPRKFYYHLKDMLQADVVLVMGTSLEVQPFAGIIDSVRWNVPRVLFNRDVVGPFKRQRRSKDFVAEGDILETLQKFSAMIGWQDEMREIITKSEGCYNVGKVTVPPSAPKPPSTQPGIKDPFVKAIWHQNARFDVFEYSSTSDSELSSEESSTESDSSQDRKKPRPVSERLYNKSKHSAKNKSKFNSNTGSANRKYSTLTSTQSARTATTKPSAGSKRHVPVIKESRRNSLIGCNGAIIHASTTAGNSSSSSRKIGSAKISVDINVQPNGTESTPSSSSSGKLNSVKNSVLINVQSTTTDGTISSSSGNSVYVNVQPTATESTLSSSSGKIGTSKNSVNGNVQPITTESSGTSSSGKIVNAMNSVNINVQPNGTGGTFSTSTTATDSTGTPSSGKIGASVNSVNVNVHSLIRPPVSLNSLSRSNSVRRQPENFSQSSNHQPKSSNYPNSSNSHTKPSNSQSKYSNSYHSQYQFSNSSSSQTNYSNSQPQSTNSPPNSSNSQPQSTNSQPNSSNSQPQSTTSQSNSSNSQPNSSNSQPQSTNSPSSNSQPQSTNSPSSNSQPQSTDSQPQSTNSQPNSYNSQSSSSQMQSCNSKTKSTNSSPNSSNSQPKSYNSSSSQSNSFNSQPQSTNFQSQFSDSFNSPTSSQPKYSNFSNSQTKSSSFQYKSSSSQTKSRHSLSKPSTSQAKDNSRKDNEKTRNGLSPVKTLRAFRERTRSADLPKLRLREKLGVRKVMETSSSESVNGTSSSNS